MEAPDHSDVLSYSLDCEGIECLLPLSDQVLTLEDEHDVLAIKNGAASGTRRASERLEYAYTLECEATDCLVPVSDQVIALEDPDDVQEIMRGVVSGSSDAGLEDRLKDRTEWIKQHKLRCEAMDCLLPYSPYLLATEDDFDVKA